MPCDLGLSVPEWSPVVPERSTTTVAIWSTSVANLQELPKLKQPLRGSFVPPTMVVGDRVARAPVPSATGLRPATVHRHQPKSQQPTNQDANAINTPNDTSISYEQDYNDAIDILATKLKAIFQQQQRQTDMLMTKLQTHYQKMDHRFNKLIQEIETMNQVSDSPRWILDTTIHSPQEEKQKKNNNTQDSHTCTHTTSMTPMP